MNFENMRFYEFGKNRGNGFWLCKFEGFDIEIYIEGNGKEVDEEWFSYAVSILQNNYDDIFNKSVNRLKSWAAETQKNYVIESIYFGKFSYGPGQIFQSGFKVLLKTDGNDNADIDANYTINFNKNKWPIGFEFSIA